MGIVSQTKFYHKISPRLNFTSRSKLELTLGIKGKEKKEKEKKIGWSEKKIVVNSQSKF